MAIDTMHSAALEYAIGVLQDHLDNLRHTNRAPKPVLVTAANAAPKKRGRQKGRKMSQEAKDKIRAAQQRRWAAIAQANQAPAEEVPNEPEASAESPVDVPAVAKRGRKTKGAGD